MPFITPPTSIADSAQVAPGVIQGSDIASNTITDDNIDPHTTTKITADLSLVTGQLGLINGGLEADLSAADGDVSIKSATTQVRKTKLDATAAPGVSDDSGAGYVVGSLWIDTTNDNIYQCVDSSSGAAIWKQLNEGTSIRGFAASNNLQASADVEENTTSGSYVTVKEIRVNRSGTLRVKYDAKGVSGTMHSQPSLNGVAKGTDGTSGSGSYSTYSNDIKVGAGDVVGLLLRTQGAGTAYAQNFRLYWDDTDISEYEVLTN